MREKTRPVSLFDVSVAHARSLARLLLAAWAAGTSSGCDFEPVARHAKPERVGELPFVLVNTLDSVGKYLLVEDPSGRVPGSRGISAWQAQKSCSLGREHPNDLRALPAPAGADSAFQLPRLSEAESDTDAELVMADEACKERGPYGYMTRSSAQYLVSSTDGRGILIGRDARGNALVFDPYGERTASLLAEGVTFSKPASTDGKDPRDVVWLIESGVLTLRTIGGRLLLAHGRYVSEAVLGPDQKRIAFVDDGVLYEATGPAFSPTQIVDDACSPVYAGKDLGAFSPCAEQQFVARYAGEDLTHYPKGVFAAYRSGSTELTYSAGADVDTFELSVRVGDGEPVPVEPALQPQLTFLLDDGRLLGVTAQAELGVFTPSTRGFERLLGNVEKVLTEYRGKSRTYSFLVQHDVTDGLGRLTVVEAPKISLRELARGVPRQNRNGFVMEEGRAFPSYPFAAPTVVLLSDAQMDAEQVRGRLHAELITEPSNEVLAREVSSWLLVARPMPGVLYSITDGPERGLWYAAF